ncbi:unnamed protein product [Linum trigynum]|uniref:Helitron helicase-like domain-containing protein n=1 Tax=Linum trigynum TaxID=586398 RepID=A0AAV2CDF5_9ROSI
MFDRNNVIVQTFRMARQKIHEGNVQEVKIKLFAKRAHDGREYDLPTGNDIAALIVDETGQDTFEPDIIVQYKSSQLKRINFHHPSLMALQYPIPFPYGEDGWHPDISCNDDPGDDDNPKNLLNDNTLSQCDYYAYRMQSRFHESKSLLLAGKLFHQYVSNALVEAERLEWIRNNQSKLRTHYVSGLLDAFLRGDSDLEMTGKHVILAASHTGSPCYKDEQPHQPILLEQTPATQIPFISLAELLDLQADPDMEELVFSVECKFVGIKPGWCYMGYPNCVFKPIQCQGQFYCVRYNKTSLNKVAKYRIHIEFESDSRRATFTMFEFEGKRFFWNDSPPEELLQLVGLTKNFNIKFKINLYGNGLDDFTVLKIKDPTPHGNESTLHKDGSSSSITSGLESSPSSPHHSGENGSKEAVDG